jgi:hypothetical protein
VRLRHDAIDQQTREAVAALAQLGRGSLERRARDLAKLVEEREALLREVAAVAFGDDFDHERVKDIRVLIEDWR